MKMFTCSRSRSINVPLLLARFCGIFILFGYLRWALLIDLVSRLGSLNAGLAIFGIYVVDSIALFVGGLVADKLGRKLTLILGAVFLSIGLLLLLLYYDYYTSTCTISRIILVMAVIVLFGLGDFDDAATYAMLAESVSSEHVNKVVTMFKIFRLVLSSIGALVLPLVNISSMRILIIMFLPTILITSVLLRETLNIVRARDNVNTRFIDKVRDLVLHVKKALSGPAKMIPLAIFIFYLACGFTGNYTPHYLLKVKKLTKEEIGTIYFISDLVNIVPLFATGFIKKFRTIAYISRLCVIVVMACLSLVPILWGPYLIPVLVTSRTAGLYFVDTLTTLMIISMSKEETRGTLYSLTYASSYIYGLGAIMGGYIYAINPNLIYPTAVTIMTGTLIILTKTIRIDK